MARDDDRHSSTERFKEENEIDRMALEGPKTEWQERSAPAAGDPVSDDEKRGLNLLGRSAESDEPLTAPRDGERRNPPADDSMNESIL